MNHGVVGARVWGTLFLWLSLLRRAVRDSCERDVSEGRGREIYRRFFTKALS